MKNQHRKVLAIACAVVAATSAHSAQIIQVKSLNTQNQASNSVAFDKFDSSLGTLTQVRITVNYLFQERVLAPNLTPDTVFAQVQNGGIQSYLMGATFVARGFTNSLPIVLNPFSQTEVAIPSHFSDSRLINNSLLFEYIGSGTRNLQIVNQVDFSHVRVNGVVTGLNTILERSMTGSAILTYTYDPIPEPASLILLPATLLLFKLKRKQNS